MPKQTKKQSKIKRFFTWFKPTSPAKGALLFAIAFAIIGGSYMAYKSFAAAIWVTYFPPKDVKCAGNCDQISDKRQKYPTNAARVNAQGNNNYVYSRFYLGHPWTAYPSYTTIPTRACAWVRATNNTQGTGIYMRLEIEDGSSSASYQQDWLNGSLTYTKFCTNYTNVHGGSHYAKATVFKLNNFADIYVSSMTIETP